MHLTDNLSVGFAPSINLARLSANPLFIAPPDDANVDGFPTYENGTQGRYIWGAGFQAGVYYTMEQGWNFGASVKSPQWFEPIHQTSQDEIGRPIVLKTNMDYPMIVSLGTSYTGFEDLVLAEDVHYVDYRNTNGFNNTGFNSLGQVTGLGWDSIFVVNLGVQYRLSETWTVRAGYSYGMNPIDNSKSIFNVASPAIDNNTIYFGGSYNLTKALMVSAAYLHAFQNSISGPIIAPFGTIPGSSVGSTVSVDSILFGVTVKF